MDVPTTRKLSKGEMGLVGMAQADMREPGVSAFQITVCGRQPLYGEWRPIWVDGGSDYNVEIHAFGASTKEAVSMGVYKIFSNEDQHIFEHVIEEFFSTHSADLKGVFPTSIKSARFQGGLTFRHGWLIIKEEYDSWLARRMRELKSS